MSIATDNIKALCFDLGNTLIEFGSSQVAYQNVALEKTLKELFGHCDIMQLKAIRDQQIMAPFSSGYRENDMRSLCEELIRELYDLTPEDKQIDALVQARYESFVHTVKLPHSVFSLLRKLHQQYRLALLSNYPCSHSILDAIAKMGLSELFEAVVISGDVGYVKPHAKPFEAMLSQLDLPAADCIYIGDNWLADVQGAKRMGMCAILTTQYVSYEGFGPADGDHTPDAQITHLNELEELLLYSPK